MSAPVLPEPEDLVVTQASSWGVKIERWAAKETDVTIVDEYRDRVAAMVAYLAKRQSPEAVRAMNRCARYLEVRIGQLVPIRQGKSDGCSALQKLPASTLAQFHTMATHVDHPRVRALIEDGASQRQVVAAARAAAQDKRKETNTHTHTKLTADERAERNAEAREMHAAGKTLAEIALHYGINDTRTVRRWLSDEPEKKRKPRAPDDPLRSVQLFQDACRSVMDAADIAVMRAGNVPRDEPGHSMYVQHAMQALDHVEIAITTIRDIFTRPTIGDQAETFLKERAE